MFTLVLTSAPATASSRAEPRGKPKHLCVTFLCYMKHLCYLIHLKLHKKKLHKGFTQLKDLHVFYNFFILQSFYNYKILAETECYGVLPLVNVFRRDLKTH